MIAVGIIGYLQGHTGLSTLNTVFAEHLSEQVRRKFFRKWYACKKRKNFVKKAHNYFPLAKHKPLTREFELNEMKNHASAIRVLCHSQVAKLPGLRRKKPHLLEIQVSGGCLDDKIKFSQNILEKA